MSIVEFGDKDQQELDLRRMMGSVIVQGKGLDYQRKMTVPYAEPGEVEKERWNLNHQ